ncbi:hypothetical protein M902_1814 [Bacteriovorax sp. BAL6_X]|uniref:hypothetical protein n=1 Tax=Bacteriovorax sp. BAL6_X TaxID=1201290 RepID=UPI000386DA17|nr:hypothetical protein [Bacteriovorax sp. BAL6_X]EPZ51816.1 hypothetical protein M902_1814 [Bacteriovorax sp. BAL6_X]
MDKKVITFNRNTIYFGTFVFILNLIAIGIVFIEDNGFQYFEVGILFISFFIFIFIVKRALREKLIMTNEKIIYTVGQNIQEIKISDITKIVAEQERFRVLEIYLNHRETPFIFKVNALEELFFEVPRWVNQVTQGQIEIDERLINEDSFMYLSRFRYNLFSTFWLIFGLSIIYNSLK